jgi:hypothetical protein
MELELTRDIFEKILNINVDKNPSSGRRVVPCRQTDGRTEGLTDKTKLRVQ